MSTDLDSKPSWQLPTNLPPQEALDGRPVQKDVDHIFETAYTLQKHREDIFLFLRTIAEIINSVSGINEEIITFDTFQIRDKNGEIFILQLVWQEGGGPEVVDLLIKDNTGFGGYVISTNSVAKIEPPDWLVMPVYNSLLKILESVFVRFPDFRKNLDRFHSYKI